MPKAGHIPMRMCLVCRKRAPKAELERYTRAGDVFSPDEKQIAEGRGSYVCQDPDCREKFLHRRTRIKRGRKV